MKSLYLYCLFFKFSTIIAYEIINVTEPLEHSECPTWDNRTNRLYFVDIHKGAIYYYSPESNQTNYISLSGTVAPVLPTISSTQQFIVGLNRSVATVVWDEEDDTVTVEILTTLAEEYPTSRTNDGKADLNGRFYVGTMGYEDNLGNLIPNEGALYLITKDTIANPEEIIAPVNISNGIAWNKANNKFFYIDTPTRQIREYDYNATSGSISFSRIAFDLDENNVTGNPDGMTIDTDDNLWIALYEGSAVIQVNSSTGELLRTINIPANRVTSAAFGNAELDVLFVTSSRYGLTEEELESSPLAGSVFAVTGLGVKGFPANRVDLTMNSNQNTANYNRISKGIVGISFAIIVYLFVTD